MQTPKNAIALNQKPVIPQPQIPSPPPQTQQPSHQPQQHSLIPPQLSIHSIRQNKRQYAGLLLFLMQVLVSVVVLVVFMTLGYVGFGTVVEGQSPTPKLTFPPTISQCPHPYLTQISPFLTIKTKTSFVFLCVELLLSFVSVVMGFMWTVKVVKRVGETCRNGLAQVKTCLRSLCLLTFTSTTLTVLLFATYLSLALLHHKTSHYPQPSCHLQAIPRQIIAITVLFGIKLLMYLGVLIILMPETYEVNVRCEGWGGREGKGEVKLPCIGVLKSVVVGEYEGGGRGEGKGKGENREVGNGCQKGYSNNDKNENYDVDLNPLKTDDFLLELKNNSIHTHHHHNPQHNPTQKLINNNFHSSNPNNSKPLTTTHHQTSQQDNDADTPTNRRMLAYQPSPTQQYHPKRTTTIPIQTQPKITKVDSVCREYRQEEEEEQTIKGGNRRKNKQQVKLQRSVQEQRQFSGVSSVREEGKSEQEDNNGNQEYLLLINSVQRGKATDMLGSLPLSSKKKSTKENQLFAQKDLSRAKLQFTSQNGRNSKHPPKSRQSIKTNQPEYPQQTEPYVEKKSDKTKKSTKIIRHNNKIIQNNLTNDNPKRQVQESNEERDADKTIIMKLEHVMSQKEKERLKDGVKK